MRLVDLASWSLLLSALVAAFAVGVAPVLVVRAIALLYPKAHPRRAELIGEMAHLQRLAQTLELARWLGESLATAVLEGVAARVSARKGAPKPAGPTLLVAETNTPLAYEHTNSKGITYYLHKTQVTLRGGLPQTIYFMAKAERNAKGEPTDLPADRWVKENPRNGFLTISKLK